MRNFWGRKEDEISPVNKKYWAFLHICISSYQNIYVFVLFISATLLPCVTFSPRIYVYKTTTTTTILLKEKLNNPTATNSLSLRLRLWWFSAAIIRSVAKKKNSKSEIRTVKPFSICRYIYILILTSEV